MSNFVFYKKKGVIRWQPETLKDWFYWCRYWIGYYLMPQPYRNLLDGANDVLGQKVIKDSKLITIKDE